MKYLYKTKVNFRGQEKSLSQLKKGSHIKVGIICPKCKSSFDRYAFVLFINCNFLCQRCSLNEKSEKTITVGNKYNKLKVVGRFKVGYSNCVCDCGKATVVQNTKLRSGHTKSCGCIISEKLKKYHKENPTANSGSNHPNWQGGITDESRRARETSGYKKWRIDVFERDRYVCQKCKKKGGTLNAHHIEPFRMYKNKRTDINNGITLCVRCHRKFHSEYGRVKINKATIDEFLK